MKKALITVLALVLALGMIIPLAAPAAAADSPQRWISVTNGPITFTENIGGVQITVCGGAAPVPPLFIPTPNLLVPASGTFVGHIVKPTTNKATEESWFEVTQFTGYIILGSAPFYFNFAGDIKVNIHNGTQPNQPIITLRSADPVPLFVPDILPAGLYQNIQMMGWKVVHAK